MDPDLDPNLQHLQDHADNYQWVVGSLVGLLDSIPHLTSESSTLTGPVWVRFGVLAALTVDGVFSAVAGSMFLPLYLGPVPFPISALLSGAVNAALVWAALQWHDSPRVAALPLYAWLVVVFALVVIGPQGGVVLGGSGIAQVTPLLLIVLGALPPALVLRRRR